MQQAMYRAYLIPLLPTVIYETAAGNMALVDVFVPQVLPTGGNDRGIYASTLCAEEVPFSSIEEADAARQGLNSTLTDPVYEVTSRLFFDLCDIWPVTPRPDIESNPVVSDIATLVLAGQYDPATPPSNGKEAAKNLSNSPYFLFNGLSHGVLRSDSAEPGELSCAAGIVVQFLDNPEMTVDGRCAKELPAVSPDPILYMHFP